jgi:hypothetical protein
MIIARKPNKLRIIIAGADVTIEPLVPGKAGQLKVVEAGRLVAALPLLLKACGACRSNDHPAKENSPDDRSGAACDRPLFRRTIEGGLGWRETVPAARWLSV